ncbi:MAG: hypothetical protein RLO04_00910 [Limnobacter sp.]|uniref:hypothetical protein n=1 Tax=Limnobacter sp. TaxID=2003368 RepID=UPI0032ECFC74
MASTIGATNSVNAARTAMVEAAMKGDPKLLASTAATKATADTELSNMKTALGAAAG